MAFLLMKKLFESNPGSLINFNLTLNASVERINIQTQSMGNVFQSYPSMLLMIRSHNTKGKVLYTFVADGPSMKAEFCSFSRIVHLAYPSNESPEKLAEMFHFMKEFNPCWTQIRVFFVDPFFKGTDAIAKAFPSAEIILSAFHICTYYKQSIYRLSLPSKTEELLIHNLKCTMCSPSQENLQKLYKSFHEFIKPDPLAKLKHEWLLCDRIWDLHRWRNGQESYAYFEIICTLREEIDHIFNKKLSSEEIIFALISFIQTQVANKRVPRLKVNSPVFLQMLDKEAASTSTNTAQTGASPPKPEVDSEAALLVCQSLKEICVPAASELCMKEFEVVQRSTQVMNSFEDAVNLQLLEEKELVNCEKQMTCTCPFYRTLKLPCRHILSFLKANQEILKPELLDAAWRKESNTDESTFPVSAETLKIVKGNASEDSPPPTKGHLDALNNQITRLLTECSDDIFQRRYHTLREVADAWIGPYEQVKL